MSQRPISVQVLDMHIADGKTTYVLYTLHVEFDGDHAWSVKRRFWEIVALRKLLLAEIKDLPDLPKTWRPRFSAGDHQFLESRQFYINNFLRAVINNDLLINHPAFLQFIGVCDKPEGPAGGPFKLGPTNKLHFFRYEFQNISDPLFGVNAFVHIQEKNQIITASQDVWMLSRMDSMISNFRLPWEKEETGVVPVGTLNLWGWNSADGKDHTEGGEMDCLSVLYFKSAVCCLTHITKRNQAIIGLDDGRIFIYEVSHTFSLTNEFSYHSGYVTGLIYEPNEDLLISCSEDKTIQVLQLNNKKIKIAEETDLPLTCMVYDSLSSRYFVGTKPGTILIYQMKANSLELLHEMSGHKGAVECLYYQEKENYLFSGGASNMVGVWRIEKSSITRSRSVGWFRGPDSKRITSILYSPSRRHLLVGLDSGSLAVWDLSPTRSDSEDKLIYLFKNFHTYAIRMIALEEDKYGTILRTCSEDGKVRLWNWPDESN